MKTIYLNRHAKSSWDRPYSRDFDRGLNRRGNLNAAFMAGRFANEVDKVKMVSSPAVRALSTARYFAEAMGMSEQEITQDPSIYGADVTVMMRLIQMLDDSVGEVMIFGHNPTFSDLATELDNKFQDHLVTCARVKIEVDVDEWSLVSADSGRVIYHDYPRKYPEMENL